MTTLQDTLKGLGYESATKGDQIFNLDQLASNFQPASLSHFNTLDDAGKKQWLTSSGFSPGTTSLPQFTDGGVGQTPGGTTGHTQQSQNLINGQTVGQYSADQVTNPTTPSGTMQVAKPIVPGAGEDVDPNVGNVQNVHKDAQQGTVAQADPNNIQQVDAAQYQSTQGQAAQGTVDPMSTMQGQLTSLYDQVKAGNAPWADAAIRRAESMMNARGMGMSTMAGAAIAQSIMEAAIPIAEFDAKTYGEMNLQNLRNRQEAMLTNTAADNAAKQFNATSANDINKFMSEMTDRLFRFNVEQKNAMETFNTDQSNSVRSFYDKMANETDRFIAQNKLDIAKSNAEWRRAINLANTAADNTANYLNVQNRFNMSQQAVADLWQQSRDTFNWAQTSGENSKDRAFRLSMYALQRQDYLSDVSSADKKNLFAAIGNIAHGIFDDAFDAGAIFGGKDSGFSKGPELGAGDSNYIPPNI